MTAARLVNEAWSEGLIPPPRMTVSEWAQAYRGVTSPSPQPGPWRNERTPYLTAIMDELSPFSAARTVALMKGSQLGATECACNWIAYSIDANPTSIMVVLPSASLAKEWSTLRFGRLIDGTPKLHGKIALQDKRTSGNSWQTKRIVGGGFLKFTWASSAPSMRSTPLGCLALDEIDDYPGDAGGQGCPVALLKRRFSNYPRGKMYLCSTPTTKNLSRIEREFLAGDQRLYFVPCPNCGHFQALVFEQLKWENNDPESVRYECLKCGDKIPERFKTQMLSAGRWVATDGYVDLKKSGFSKVADITPILGEMNSQAEVSFHLSAMYSPLGWYGWKTLARDWFSAQGNIRVLKTMVNTVFGETWEDRGVATDPQRLFDRRERFQLGVVPDGGLFVVAFADIQADRIECEFRAFGRRGESWSFYYEVIQPSRPDGKGGFVPRCTSDPEPWKRLEELLRQAWPIEGGGSMPLYCAGVDTGYNPEPVYELCRKFPQPSYGPAGAAVWSTGTVVPTKGGASGHKLIENISDVDAARKREGLRIVTIGTFYAKQSIYEALRQNQPIDDSPYPDGYFHLPDYNWEYFRGLASEQRIIHESGKAEWRKIYSRNEPLDCAVGHVAMAELIGANNWTESQWQLLQERIDRSRSQSVVAPEPTTRRVRGSFL